MLSEKRICDGRSVDKNSGRFEVLVFEFKLLGVLESFEAERHHASDINGGIETRPHGTKRAF